MQAAHKREEDLRRQVCVEAGTERMHSCPAEGALLSCLHQSATARALHMHSYTITMRHGWWPLQVHNLEQQLGITRDELAEKDAHLELLR